MPWNHNPMHNIWIKSRDGIWLLQILTMQSPLVIRLLSWNHKEKQIQPILYFKMLLHNMHYIRAINFWILKLRWYIFGKWPRLINPTLVLVLLLILALYNILVLLAKQEHLNHSHQLTINSDNGISANPLFPLCYADIC